MPKAGEIIVDVGASIGAFSIRSSLIVGHNGNVIAIEPEPRSFIILKSNIKINEIKNIQALNIALSNKESKSILYVRKDIPYWSSLKSSMVDFNSVRGVRTTTLDKLFKELGLQRIDLLKIDTQGSEREIIEGSIGLLKNGKIRKLEIEIHDNKDIKYISNILKMNKYNLNIIYTDQYRIIAHK
jgi:FkbM family methyltransferase